MEQGPPLGQRIPDWSPSAPAARRGWAAGAAGSSEAEGSEGRGTGRRRGGLWKSALISNQISGMPIQRKRGRNPLTGGQIFYGGGLIMLS